MLSNHETLGSWVSETIWLVTVLTNLKRHPWLQLLVSPYVHANGPLPLLCVLAQDLKSLVREYDGLSSLMYTHSTSQETRRQGNWSQEWMLWYVESSSLQGSDPQPPAAGDVACWWLTGESLPRNHPPLGRAASSKGTPSTTGSQYSMLCGYRDSKTWPLCLNWGHLWRTIPDSVFLTGLVDMSMQTSSQFNIFLGTPVLLSPLRLLFLIVNPSKPHTGKCLSQGHLQPITAPFSFLKRTTLDRKICSKYNRAWILCNQRKWHIFISCSKTFTCKMRCCH